MVLIPFADGVVLPIIGGYAIALERPYIYPFQGTLCNYIRETVDYFQGKLCNHIREIESILFLKGCKVGGYFNSFFWISVAFRHSLKETEIILDQWIIYTLLTMI